MCYFYFICSCTALIIEIDSSHLRGPATKVTVREACSVLKHAKPSCGKYIMFMWNCRFKWAHWGKAAQHRIGKMLSVWTKPELQNTFIITAHICSFNLSTKSTARFSWMDAFVLLLSRASHVTSLQIWSRDVEDFGFMVELELVRSSKQEERKGGVFESGLWWKSLTARESKMREESGEGEGGVGGGGWVKRKLLPFSLTMEHEIRLSN